MLHAKRLRFSWLDAALLLAVLAVGVWLYWRVEDRLSYDWDWSVIARYLVRRDAEGGLSPNLLLSGLFTTLRLSAWTMLGALMIGLAAGLGRALGGLFIRLVCRTYIEIIRGTPPLVLVFIFYFFIGDQIMTSLGLADFARSLSPGPKQVVEFLFAPVGLLPEFMSALLTLALYEGAYIAEIVRAGVEGVEKGQWEASWALGLSPLQRLTHVVLPQAFQSSLPALAGQFISTIKDSSIVSVISIQELTFQGMEIMASTSRTFEVWLTVMGAYLALCLCCSLAARRLETVLTKPGATLSRP